MITTTMNIGYEAYTLLLQVSKESGLDINLVLNEIARLIMKNNRKDQTLFSTVRYQPDMPAGWYRSIRVILDNDVYEGCQDFRKVFKVSVSKALCDGIVELYDLLLSTLMGVSTFSGNSYCYEVEYFVDNCEYLLVYRKEKQALD